MVVTINRIMTALEGRIFRYGLALCTAFRVLRSIIEFSTGEPIEVKMLGIFNLGLLILLMTSLKRQKDLSFIILHGMFLLTTWITWPTSGGYDGVLPYAIIAITAFAIFSAHGFILATTLMGYSALIIYLVTYAEIGDHRAEPRLLMQINFITCTLLTVLLCVYAKNTFERYRRHVLSVNERLDASSEVLSEQANQVQLQSNKLQVVRKELETKIIRKHVEKREKDMLLSQYAYFNAHRVRGPLARILGLIAIIEQEELSAKDKRYLELLRSHAVEMDDVTRQISDVLS